MKIPQMIAKINKRMTIKEIARQLKVPERRIYLWKAGTEPKYYAGKKIEKLAEGKK